MTLLDPLPPTTFLKILRQIDPAYAKHPYLFFAWIETSHRQHHPSRHGVGEGDTPAAAIEAAIKHYYQQMAYASHSPITLEDLGL